jgi:hypothetical protein
MAKSLFIVSRTNSDFEWEEIQKFGSLNKALDYTRKREHSEPMFSPGLHMTHRQYFMIERA